MNIVKDYTTISMWVNQIDVLEVVILLMTNITKYVPKKTEDLNLIVFNVITGTTDSKTLRRHVSCVCKCKFDGRKCNSNQKWNNDKCRYEHKNIIYVRNIIFLMLLRVVYLMKK